MSKQLSSHTLLNLQLPIYNTLYSRTPNRHTGPTRKFHCSDEWFLINSHINLIFETNNIYVRSMLELDDASVLVEF